MENKRGWTTEEKRGWGRGEDVREDLQRGGTPEWKEERRLEKKKDRMEERRRMRECRT
jgi:hypothetical protein